MTDCTLNFTTKNIYVTTSVYEGIPENLILNVIGTLLIIILFTILRKRAGDYGRIAITNPNEQRYLISTSHGYNVWTSLFYGDVSNQDENQQMGPEVATFDKGYASWMKSFVHLRDEQIYLRCGPDAMDYLSFQRHVIVYLCLMCIICVGIILPVNFQGTLEGNSTDFGHTTLSNLEPTSHLLWVHALFAAFFVPLAIFFMRRFSMYLKSNIPEVSSNVIMIVNIPKEHCHSEIMTKHFQEAYPETEIDQIEFAYDIKKLIEIDWEKRMVEIAKHYCEKKYVGTGKRLMMRPYACSNLCRCFCCDKCGCKQVYALEFYMKEEERLFNAMKTAKLRALQSPLGIAFISFTHPSMANEVYQNFKLNILSESLPKSSSVSKDLALEDWQVNFAPLPEDIIWENLESTQDRWWIRAVCINILVFLILFFLTTPSIILSNIQSIYYNDDLKKNSLLSEALPVLLLIILKSLLPVLVYHSDYYIKHWTRSAQNHAVMRKTFIYMLLMLLILPALGLTSAKALIEWIIKIRSDGPYRWKCLFLPDKGAFFVNFVISSSLIGNAFDLIRFSDLFLYFMRYSCIRSPAEKESVRKQILYEYQYSIQYAYMLLTVTMVIVFSVSCPLIVPFGIFYMLLKHCVDRYNIYFAYAPAQINKEIHGTAIKFFMFALFLLQLVLLLFAILRQGYDSPVTYFLIAVIALMALIYLCHLIFGWCKEFAPIARVEYDAYTSQASDVRNGSTPSSTHTPFRPGILKYKDSSPPEIKEPTKSYGTQSENYITSSDVTIVEEAGSLT